MLDILAANPETLKILIGAPMGATALGALIWLIRQMLKDRRAELGAARAERTAEREARLKLDAAARAEMQQERLLHREEVAELCKTMREELREVTQAIGRHDLQSAQRHAQIREDVAGMHASLVAFDADESFHQ